MRAGQSIREDQPELYPQENNREGNKKIIVGASWNKYYWAIHYKTGMEMDGNMLFFIEGSRELLPGYVKTSKGLILPREIYYALSSMDGMVKEIGVVRKEKSKIKTHTRAKTHQYTNTIGSMGKRGNIQGKGTDNDIRIP